MRFEYTENGIRNLKSFCGDFIKTIKKERRPDARAEAHIITMEDGNNNQVEHIATEGDWIIKGVSGEFYPCKPYIFELTYDKVE